MADRIQRDGYVELVAAPGEAIRRTVRGGETLSNILFNIQADGSSAHVDASGSGWAIRNVGLHGLHSSTNTCFSASVTDPNGVGVIENVYLGDGVEDFGTDQNAIGLWVDGTDPDAHAGTLEIRNLHISRFINNGLYGSGVATQQGRDAGAVKVSKSYFRSNNVAQVRFGAGTDELRDSTILSYESEVIPEGPDDGGRVKGGTGVWGHYSGWGTALVENCDIDVTGANAMKATSGGCELLARNCRVDGNIGGAVTTENVTSGADTSPPAGTPMTALQAATGGGTPTDPTQAWNDGGNNTIEVISNDGNTADYVIEAAEAQAGPNANTDPSDPFLDTVDCSGSLCVIDGHVIAQRRPGDDFIVAGGIGSVSATPNAGFYLNGIRITADELSNLGTISEPPTNGEEPPSDPVPDPGMPLGFAILTFGAWRWLNRRKE